MRTEQEILAKFNELADKELRRKLTTYLTRSPINCRFNCRHRIKGNGAVGFCFNPSVLIGLKKQVFVCQEDETAQGCQCYECKNTEHGVRQEFVEELKSPSVCGQKYPKLAVLLWSMQKMPYQEQETRRERLVSLLREMIRAGLDILRMRWLR